MIRNALQRFMYGRYGNDNLNTFLMVVFLVTYFLYAVTHFYVFNLLSTVAVIWEVFRMFSRNHAKRRAENAKFMELAAPVMKWWRLRRTIHRDKEHVYFKCPSCSQQLRVPRGKGKITVTCRSCGAVFQEKS